jgi:hypothetical protein
MDSLGQSESSLIEQLGQKMRFTSAAAAPAAAGDKEEGELSDHDPDSADLSASRMKEAPEQKEEEGGHVIQRYILQGLAVMKGGQKSEKREDAEVMEDIHRMKEEMEGDDALDHPDGAARTDEDELDELDEGNVTDDEAAAQSDDDDDEDADGRAWKRARHEPQRASPSSHSSPPYDRRHDEVSDFDTSAPSSPHHEEHGVHHAFDHFSAVKPLQSAFEQLDHVKEDGRVGDGDALDGDAVGLQAKGTGGMGHATLLSV